MSLQLLGLALYIARALIDPGSSASFIHVHERLAQHLCLQHRCKNATEEGVIGASTQTRDSVWFQVSGVEDNVEKVEVEAYVIKKFLPKTTHTSYSGCSQLYRTTYSI